MLGTLRVVNDSMCWLLSKQVGLAALLTLASTQHTAAVEAMPHSHAKHASMHGEREVIEPIRALSGDDPLRPYAIFTELTRDLSATPDADIEAFLERYPRTQLATRLRLAYLERLAAAERWADYVRVYHPDDSTERRCLYLRALIETGRAEEALDRVAPLWRSARSQPDACDPVFAAWRAAGRLTPERVFERLRLAMEAGERGLARHLAGLLPESKRPWHALWMAVDGDPSLVLAPESVQEDHPQRAAILAHGLVGLASTSPERAAEALERLQPLLRVDVGASDRAHAAIGQALARADDPRAFAVWDGLRETDRNETAQEVRLRAAIAAGAWSWVAEWVARMPEGPSKRERWLYWQGRAEFALGREQEAHATLTRAATGRSLWAFMAADRLGLPYRLEQVATPARPEAIRDFVRGPTHARLRALSALDRETDMRREWRELMRHADVTQLLAAAYVADVMGWHDQAIQALARAGFWDDLALRFPLAHRAKVTEQAWQIGIEPDWIFAILRQESLFSRSLASHAGAIGLMQLLPTTAREVASALDLDPPSRWDLLVPEVNIRLGSAYLAGMRDRFGHVALATAAYNAGPERVARWLPETCQEADLWIMAIPFRETRRYVERVLAYRVIYADRLGLPPARLSDWLPPVPSAGYLRS